MSNTIVLKGSVSIIVDAAEMEARLVYVPGRNREETWNIVSLDGLVRKERLPAVPGKTLEQFLEKAAGSRQPFDIVVCRGQEPLPPLPEQVSWTRTPLPGEIAAVAPKILEKAGPPEFTVSAGTRREKKQRRVERPGRQAEIETYYEDVPVYEKIGVDPDVLALYYAERGSPAGSVSPARGGKPGKTVYGEIIKPPETEQERLLFGAGLELRKSYIVPVVTGILRIGQGWADVVPVPEPFWSIELGENGTGLFLDYTPGHPFYPHPEAEEILDHAEPPETPGVVLIGTAELNALLDKATAAGAPVEHFPLYRYGVSGNGGSSRRTEI